MSESANRRANAQTCRTLRKQPGMNFQFDITLGVRSRESGVGRSEVGDTMEPCCLWMQLDNDETRSSVVVGSSGRIRADVGHVGEFVIEWDLLFSGGHLGRG